ncbi:MAG TPA: iron donor protein CyaY [Casimicrobiaceae bacterium]
MQDETTFIALTDRVLDAIGAALDATASGDLDWSENDGVLTVDCGAGGRIVVNRHVSNRELWVAAKSGGFHFQLEGGAWKDRRSGEELSAVLRRLLQEQGAGIVDIAPLPV